jgi:pimeloyl-ACP methyl ester carboxylesterase
LEVATVDGIRLQHEVVGEGEPVVFIHGSLIADAFRPLFSEPSLVGFNLIAYRRRGYAGSSSPDRVLSIAEQASDCRALLRHLGVERAHVVGHSFGGVVALQLALDVPDLVHTLALLEPALAVGASGPAYRQSLANASEHYREVGPAIVLDEMMRARWPGYRTPLERLLPGAFDQALSDAHNSFEWELPGLLEWEFDEEKARRITQPVLSVLGSESEALWPRFGETHRALCAWLPNAEAFILPGAHHFLQMEKPREMANGLAVFLARHPLESTLRQPATE